MPPEDEPQLSDTEFSQITGILTENLTIARKNLAATGGVNPIRRLNEREYINSIKQLFGLNIHDSLIPDDIRTESFDTAGGEQYFDGALLEQYVRIGTAIAKEGFKWSGKPYAKRSAKRVEAEDKDRGKNPYAVTSEIRYRLLPLQRQTWRTGHGHPHGERSPGKLRRASPRRHL